MKNKLLEFRTKKSITQKEVAKSINKTTSYYGMLEKGKRKPSIEVAHELAKFFKTTIDEIFF